MKYRILIYLIFFLLNTKVTAQSGWEIIADGTGLPKENIFFVDSITGFVGNQGDIFQRLSKTTDGGYSWNFFSNINISSVHFPNKSVGYLSDGSTIYKSKDLGESWDTVKNNIGFAVQSIFFTDSITGYASGGISGGFGKIGHTTDGGITWSVFSVNGSVHSIHFLGSVIGYAIASDQFSEYIYKTTDSGQTWFSQNIPSGIESLRKIHFASDDIGYIVARSFNPLAGYIIKTDNGGQNWYIQYSLPDVPLRSVFATSKDTAYVIGANGTILKTTNGGSQWNFQTSQTTEELRTLYFLDNNTGYIAGGKQLGATYTHIILKTTTGGEPIVSVDQSSNQNLPEKFILQNYPNPFNSGTTINFSLPDPSEISMKVYNLLGEEITTLISSHYSAGIHMVNWNAGNLPSGIYLCKLKARYNQKVIKLSLMK